MATLRLGTTNEVAMPTNKKFDGCSTDEFDFEDRAGSALVTMYLAVSQVAGTVMVVFADCMNGFPVAINNPKTIKDSTIAEMGRKRDCLPIPAFVASPLYCGK